MLGEAVCSCSVCPLEGRAQPRLWQRYWHEPEGKKCEISMKKLSNIHIKAWRTAQRSTGFLWNQPTLTNPLIAFFSPPPT